LLETIRKSEPSVLSFLIGANVHEIMVVALSLLGRLDESIAQVYNITHLQNDKSHYSNGGRG